MSDEGRSQQGRGLIPSARPAWIATGPAKGRTWPCVSLEDSAPDGCGALSRPVTAGSSARSTLGHSWVWIGNRGLALAIEASHLQSRPRTCSRDGGRRRRRAWKHGRSAFYRGRENGSRTRRTSGSRRRRTVPFARGLHRARPTECGGAPSPRSVARSRVSSSIPTGRHRSPSCSGRRRRTSSSSR